MKEDYFCWVQRDMERLEAAYDALAANPHSRKCIEVVFAISHDMKGQAGTFDYGLITDILNGLCRYIEGRECINTDQLQVTRRHLHAVKIVIETKLTGQGDATGESLPQGIRVVVEGDTCDED